mmetsp:Transcript_75399/g.208104  ORF Transcript_75399/g.208104 Transcript_75399/m.208104 type:complete len:131 (+) Transcript_75399:1559-1951(+)
MEAVPMEAVMVEKAVVVVAKAEATKAVCTAAEKEAAAMGKEVVAKDAEVEESAEAGPVEMEGGGKEEASRAASRAGAKAQPLEATVAVPMATGAMAVVEPGLAAEDSDSEVGVSVVAVMGWVAAATAAAL